ncbi:hypothetical protein GCM10025787_44280 [Saccharopolyspora rosea]
MKTVEAYDVDAYAILDPPAAVSVPEGASRAEDAAPPPTTAVSGNGALRVGNDLDQSHHKTVINYKHESIVLADDEFVAQISSAARVQARTGRGLQDREALQRLADNYVPPPGLLVEAAEDERETAFQILQRRRVVLIGAEGRDCGQFAAAQRLGFELQQRNPQLVVREELSDEGFRLHADALLVEDDPAAVLVDLRESDDVDVRGVRQDLVGFTEALERHSSYLVLIIPPGMTRAFEEHFPGRVHVLGKPSSAAVFACHVRGIDPDALVARTSAAQSLERLWPPKVKEIADAVSDRSDRDEDPDRVLRDLLDDELHSRTPALRKQIRDKQESGKPEWLALLLAASVLEGAPPEHIVEASDQMLARNGLNAERPVPLLQLSPHARLGQLADEQFEHFDSDTRWFRPPGFGARVLGHFWREHPDLRAPMLDWIGELPAKVRDLDSDELDQIADRSAELAGAGGAGIAIKLAQQWAKTTAGASDRTTTSNSPSDRYRRSIAVRLLTATGIDPSLGRSVRGKLWEWSRRGNADLQLMTAEVCAGIGQSFPRVALTRLKHLANADNAHVREAVRNALRQIGNQLGASRFLRYVSEWFDSAPPARLRLLSDGVSAVLEELNEEVEADAATSFWRRALATMPPEDSCSAVRSWLRTAAQVGRDERNSMVESLVRATDSNPFTIAYLLRVVAVGQASSALGALADDPLTEVVHLLCTRLDEVDHAWSREEPS